MRALLLTLTTCLFVFPAQVQYSGGSGTADDPYQIATAADLIALGETPEDYDKHFILMADIDLSGYVYDRAVIAPDINDTDEGFQGTAFSGSFDGNFCIIHNLTIKGANYLGLIGVLGGPPCPGGRSQVHNLALSDASIDATGDDVGILIGQTVSFRGCRVRIANCSSSGIVHGNTNVGGLLGSILFGEIERCSANVTIYGNKNVGGLIGWEKASTITDSYSKGTVFGECRVGGLAGHNQGKTGDPEIRRCYSATEVSGNAEVGAFYGVGHVNSEHCFFDDDIADVNASGDDTSDGIKGLSTADMQDIETFRGAGWDLPGASDGLNEIWEIPEEGGYPIHAAPAQLAGKGTATDPYLINTVIELGAIIHYDSPYACFQLGCDIDLSGMTLSKAVIPEFYGSLDGNGNTVQNLTIVGVGTLGLVGTLSGGRTVNLGVVDANIVGIGGHSYIGMLAGWNAYGTIDECYSIGAASGGDWGVGGLVGGNDGTISNCYSMGEVLGNDAGGLVHWNGGSIIKCYSTCEVIGEDEIGGLVGEDSTYTDGIHSCFWDTESSGLLISDGGVGLTTAEMQSAATFLEAGWDFVGELENGPNDVWKIVEGQTCPLLSWQKYGGGTGEPNDPYLIYTAEHLNTLGAEPNDYDKHFKLMADIDLSGYVYDRAVIAPDVNDAEDWFQGAPFVGVFDGNGHTVSCLTIGGGGHIGLFGALGAEARVLDLGVEAVDVNGTGSYVGGLCGRNSGTISECHSAGSVTGGDASLSLGGLCGANGGTISRCKATASVAGGLYSSWLGGLCGVNSLGGGAISDCYAGGSVTAGDYSAALGGLCGDNWGTISRCYATAIVTSGDGSGALGGLCGGNFDTVSNCFWDRQTCGTSYSSGGLGMSTADMMTESTYIGWNNGAWVIDEGRDYPHLAWENTPGTIIDYEHPRSYVGNGEDQPFVLESPEDIVCLSLRSADWDKSFVLANDIDMSSVTDYRPVGLFTGRFDGRDHVVQNLAIDADVIGNSSQLGLFGKVGSGGRVNDLRLLDVTVTGPDHSLYLGSLCGQNDGVISNCHARATVSGGQSLGGLCGDSGAGIISNSHATGSVTGASYLGGLCGTNGGTVSACHASVNVRRDGAGYSPSLGGLVGSNFNSISNCYATGSVTGASTSEDLAGLVGENSWGGRVSNCYATGRVTGGMWALGGLCGKNWGDIAASFWDVGTSGQATSAGGTGKVTAEMQTAATFLNAGWDFFDETENGTDDIWWIDEGQDYPRLWWEAAGGGNSNF